MLSSESFNFCQIKKYLPFTVEIKPWIYIVQVGICASYWHCVCLKLPGYDQDTKAQKLKQFQQSIIKRCVHLYLFFYSLARGCRGRDRMIVGFQLPVQLVPITTKVVSSNPVHGEVYLIQHYVITFVSELQQVSGFLQVLRLPPPMKLTTTI